MYLADPAVADEFACAEELPARALPAPRLPDDLVAANGLDHRAAFGDGEGEGFFGVDVASAIGGGNGDQGVPVVGHSDRDHVEVVSCEQLTEVAVAGAALVVVGIIDHLLGVIAVLSVDIRHGDNLQLLLAKEASHVSGALAADAYAAHGETVARSRRAVEPERGGGDDHRKCDCSRAEGGATLQERTAVDFRSALLGFLLDARRHDVPLPIGPCLMTVLLSRTALQRTRVACSLPRRGRNSVEHARQLFSRATSNARLPLRLPSYQVTIHRKERLFKSIPGLEPPRPCYAPSSLPSSSCSTALNFLRSSASSMRGQENAINCRGVMSSP